MAHYRLTSYVFIVPLIILLIRFKKLTEIQQWIALLVTIAGLSSLTAVELATRSIYNTPVIHIYAIVELALYTWIFHKSMPQRLTQKWAYAVIGGFSAIAVFNTIFLQSIMEFNSNARSLESFILIVFSLIYFYHLFQEMKVYHLQKLPTFWVAAGVLINFSVNLLFFSFVDWLIEHHIEVFEVVHFIHSMSNNVLYILLGVGLLVNPAKAK